MRYVSNNAELKKISIYTNIGELKDELKCFFHETRREELDDRVKVALINSREPFLRKSVNTSEVIFDIVGNFPEYDQKIICRGYEKDSLEKADLWLEFVNSIFSIDMGEDEFDICGFFDTVSKYTKMELEKYLLTDKIFEDVSSHRYKSEEKIKEKEFFVIVFNGYIKYGENVKKEVVLGIENKYKLKCFFKTSTYLFDDAETIGYMYKVIQRL